MTDDEYQQHFEPLLGSNVFVGKEGERRRYHPDTHDGLGDWFMYGPRDVAISNLVDRLAYGKGWRLSAIEQVIKDALQSAFDAV